MAIHADNVIKVIPNFISDREMKFWIDYNDELLITHKSFFAILEDGTRPLLEFGIDRSPEHKDLSHHNFDIISDAETRVRDLMSRVQDKTKEIFNEKDDVYVCSFWLAKQLPGAFVSEHDDTDGGFNTHFKYSAILYLNNMRNPATLSFTEWGYNVVPSAGDLVVFDTELAGRHKVNRISEDRYTIPMWMTLDPKYAL